MNVAAAVVDLAAFTGAIALLLPVVRRTGLGVWHPAVWWLALEAVFFGLGAAFLAVAEGRPGPALFVAAAVMAFALAVAASGGLAVRRAVAVRAPVATEVGTGTAGADGIRWPVVLGLAVLGAIALGPTLLAVGIPALAGDVTGARVEIGGPELQVLRVAWPGGVLVAILVAARSGGRRERAVALGAFTVAAVFELALASRYLAAELTAAAVIGLGLARRPIPARALAAIAAVAATVFIAVGILRAYDQAAGREIGFAAERTVNRILLIEPRTLDALQTAIPAEEPFFGGLTWLRRLGPALGRADIPNLGYWVYPRLFPDQVVPGYAAPGLLGEAWANLGWLGVGLFAALGLAVERLGALVAIRRRATPDVTAAALLVLFVARTHAVGLDGLAVLVMLIATWRGLVAPLGGMRDDLGRIVSWRV